MGTTQESPSCNVPCFCFLQVALCAGCNAVYPFAAFIIGIIAGMAYVAWSTAMLYLKIDDPLDAVAGNRAFESFKRCLKTKQTNKKT